MIKKLAINKVVLLSMYIVLLSLFYFIPVDKEIETTTSNESIKSNSGYVFLLDKDNYVSMVNIYYDEVGVAKEIYYKMNVLMTGINHDNLYPLIPKKTVLNSVNVDENKVYLDFNASILNVSSDLTESMLEAIIYTVCEINGLNEIYLSVDGKTLDEINGIKLEYPLSKSYGINKQYNIDNLNNLNRTTVFFSKDDYYVPVTFINNDSSDKVNIIIEELKSSINSQYNLNGLIDEKFNIVSYDIENNIFSLNINESIDDKTKTVISYSITSNYDVDNVIFNTINN